jgi:hypothetical protein
MATLKFRLFGRIAIRMVEVKPNQNLNLENREQLINTVFPRILLVICTQIA